MQASIVRTPRRGTVLVWFALLVFVLFGLAALVIDLGLVRAEQRRMQSLADSVALEGLRFRDDITPLDVAANANPTTRDAARRAHAAALTTPPLETNGTGNEPHGDLVAGEFLGGGPANEAADYSRTDFTPQPDGSAFLARLRRGNAPNPLDETAGVSSREPGLPLLFGRASLLGAGSGLRRHGFTVRATSIAAGRRAAQVGPAYPEALYPAQTPAFVGIPGLAPFSLNVGTWNTLTTDTLTVDATGTLTGALSGGGNLLGITGLGQALGVGDTQATVAGSLGFPVPPFVVRMDTELIRVAEVNGTVWTVQRGAEGTQPGDHASDAPVTLHATLGLGTASASRASQRPARLDLLTGGTFCVLVPLVEETTGLVAGFGRVQWSVPSWDAGAGYRILVTRLPSAILPWNATPTLPQTLNLSPAQFAVLWAAHTTLPDSVLAPALVR